MGTPKSSTLVGFSIRKQLFLSTPICGTPPNNDKYLIFNGIFEFLHVRSDETCFSNQSCGVGYDQQNMGTLSDIHGQKFGLEI